MKTMKGLDFWVRGSIWLELIIPGYFFGKTFGTSDAKYRVLDKFMYPELFINISGYFRDLPSRELYYTGRLLGVLAGAVIGVLFAMLIGVFYKWVLKDWAYAKAARIGALAFILIALLTGFMSDFFNENIGLELTTEQEAPADLLGKNLVQDYGGFEKGTEINEENALLLAYYGTVRANNPDAARGWWIASIVFMYTWFVLYFVCARRLFMRNRVPKEKWLKLQMVNFGFLLLYLRMGFGISPHEYHLILTRAPYLFGGN